jgi:hypothetical protein
VGPVLRKWEVSPPYDHWATRVRGPPVSDLRAESQSAQKIDVVYSKRKRCQLEGWDAPDGTIERPEIQTNVEAIELHMHELYL